MTKRFFLFLLALLVASPACGGSDKKVTKKPKAKKVAKAPPPEPEPEPPPPPPPDPREDLTMLLGGMTDSVTKLKGLPFEEWAANLGPIQERDAELEGYVEKLPAEAKHIAKIRKHVAELTTQIGKKKKKKADKAIKALEKELAVPLQPAPEAPAEPTEEPAPSE